MRQVKPLVLGLTVFLGLLWVASHHGQNPKRSGQPEPNYAADLPRIPPKAPTEAIQSFRLRPGFRIELVAAEPLLRDPVALDIDENGRMYVVEYPEYNQYAAPASKERGAVRLLVDTTGDGRFDHSTIFADNLDSPTAVACWDGGVFIAAVPDILYCKDTTGDGIADVRERVFTGFGRDHAGEAMLNSFRWGLDNRYHVSTSLAGGDVRIADKMDARTVSVRGQGFLFDPRTRTFELTSGGGQHGMGLDDWGNTFVCSNSEPVHQILYDGRYVARNPAVQAPPAAVNIAPAGKYTKLFRTSAVEPWRLLRTRLRSQKIVPGSDEGGEASGFFTGATGITAYRGDAWPAEYRGNLFVGEVSGNLIYRAKLAPKGVAFVAERADPNAEFLSSTDNWFRPVQFANAPDGCLYVIDMYRELIEGAAFLPPAILKHLDPMSGKNRGRIYRIVPENFRQPPKPKLGSATTPELVALLDHRNGWHRDTAARLLYQRQDPEAREFLIDLVKQAKLPEGRAHALHALAGLQKLTPELVVHGLKDADAHVREQALRLAEKFANDPAVATQVAEMMDDPDLRVRYQLAFTLGAFRTSKIAELLGRLAVREGADPYFRLAILSSSGDCAGPLFRRLSEEKAYRKSPAGQAFLTALAGQIGAAGKAEDFAAVLASLPELAREDRSASQALLRAVAGRQPGRLRDQLRHGDSAAAAALFADLLNEARKTLADAGKPAEARAAALRTLGLAPFAENKDRLTPFLQPLHPAVLQLAALETLGAYDDPAVALLLLEAWPGFSPQPRATALEVLLSRPAWIAAFLDAVEKGTVKRPDIDPARIALLRAHPDSNLRERAARLFSSATLPARQKVVDAYQKTLSQPGDAIRGKQVFAKHCASCHRLDNVGQSLGADLAAIRDRGLDAVLLNILDPNREVKPQFLSYVVVLNSGRSLTGMITSESASSLTLRKPDGTTETILRNQIDELRSTGLSFMPEGLEQQIDLAAMADLLAYLNAKR